MARIDNVKLEKDGANGKEVGLDFTAVEPNSVCHNTHTHTNLAYIIPELGASQPYAYQCNTVIESTGLVSRSEQFITKMLMSYLVLAQ